MALTQSDAPTDGGTTRTLVDLGDGIVGMRTERASIRIDPADGGRLLSLVIDGADIIGACTAPPAEMPPGFFTGSFVMAPFVSRTAYGRFEFEGTEWVIPPRVGPHAMHGLVFDRAWTVDGDALVIDFDERWPFGGRVTQTFELGNDHVTITVRVSNDVRSMPAIAGFHPWFRNALESGEDAEYEFEPGIRYLLDDEGIPVGTIPGGGERPWDDAFTDVATPPRIAWGDRLAVEIGSVGSHWIVCETMPGAFCIEPLSGPINGLATGEYTTVEPGSPLVHDLTIRW
ncbi:MAG: aldose epimerase family protein [Leifsonia sp.]|nr:aldose epimerase family protein [Leifsonia sp.]MDQ1589120.1 aldose 1-epimerase [Microbacteriaceae bacterium]